MDGVLEVILIKVETAQIDSSGVAESGAVLILKDLSHFFGIVLIVKQRANGRNSSPVFSGKRVKDFWVQFDFFDGPVFLGSPIIVDYNFYFVL